MKFVCVSVSCCFRCDLDKISFLFFLFQSFPFLLLLYFGELFQSVFFYFLLFFLFGIFFFSVSFRLCFVVVSFLFLLSALIHLNTVVERPRDRQLTHSACTVQSFCCSAKRVSKKKVIQIDTCKVSSMR